MPEANVEDVLEQLGIEISSVGDREISAHCPFHSDRHPSFSINRVSGLFLCHQCGERGTLSYLIEKVGGEKANAVVIMRDLRSRNIGKPKDAPPEKVVDPIYLLAHYESFRNPPGWALEERKITKWNAEAYGLKWDKGWIIPIRDPFDYELWGWQFKQMQFVSNYPKAIQKSKTLFGLRELDFRSEVALVESPLDVVRLASVGIESVASFGAFVSRVQISLLVEAADEVVLALDNDEEGQRQTEKIYRRLAKQLPTRVVEYPGGAKDPGDLTDKQVLKVF